MAVVGVAVALGSAALYDTGYVLEKQALGTLPPVPAGPVGLVRTVKGSPRWLAGFAAMLGGLGLQLLAFTLAPVPVVQPVLAAGVVALVLVSRWVLGERLGRRETAAAALVLAAVAAIAASSGADARLARSVPVGRFAIAVVPLLFVASMTAWAGRRRVGRDHYRGLALLAGSAGLLYGAAAVAEKAVATQLVRHGLLAGVAASLATAYPWLLVVATAGGLAVFQVGLQRHLASLMVPLANVVAGAFALAGAAAVFAERLVPGGWWAVPRLAGFGAVAGAVSVLCARPATAGAEGPANAATKAPATAGGDAELPTVTPATKAALWS